MQCSFERDPILKVLTLVSGAVEKKTTLPILGTFLLRGDGQQLSITGTDLETELTARCAVDFHEPFAVCLPRRFLEIIKAFPADKPIVMLSTGEGDNEKVMIKCGRSRFTLQTLPASDYPASPDQAVSVSMTLEQSVLKDLLRRCDYAMAVKDVRYYLNGVLFEVQSEQLIVTGTNGHRLATIGSAVTYQVYTEPQEFILGSNAVNELKRILGQGPCTLSFSQNSCRLVINDTVFISKLIDGKYPDYRRMMKTDYPTNLVLPREACIDAIRRVMLVLDDKEITGCEFAFTQEGLKLTARYQDQEAFEEVDTEHQGDDLVIGFNPKYVKDALESMTGDHARIGMTDAQSMICLEGHESDEGKHLIMVMRL